MDHQGDELKALLSQATSRADEKELLIFEMEEKVETLSVQLEQYKAGKYFLMDIITYNTLLFYQIEPYKKGPFLVLPSSVARNSSAPNAKRIFQIHRGILEGCTNRARPSQPSLKNCQNGTF